jgi:hypothetical protein
MPATCTSVAAPAEYSNLIYEIGFFQVVLFLQLQIYRVKNVNIKVLPHEAYFPFVSRTSFFKSKM